MLTFPSQNDKKTEKNSDRASVLEKRDSDEGKPKHF